MRRTILAAAVCCLSLSSVSAQDIYTPGMEYSGSIGAYEGGQLYPFDRQDPWLHGQYQRIPAYGGFSTFRPYNYRHVFAQTQIATSVWGAPHGQPYSQQFWNRYRTDYLNGSVHSQASARPVISSGVNPVSYQAPAAPAETRSPAAASKNSADRPVHVYPSGLQKR